MNAIPVPQVMAEEFPELKQVVVGAPGTGALDGDGSSPDKAYATEALIGTDKNNNWPVIREYWLPDEEDMALLQDGCPIELVFWMPQMPVHALHVQPRKVQ